MIYICICIHLEGMRAAGVCRRVDDYWSLPFGDLLPRLLPFYSSSFFCASTPFFINNSTLLSAIIAPRYLACESGRLEGRVVVTPRRRPIMLLRTNITSFLFFSFRRPRLPAARRESVLGSVTIFLQIGWDIQQRIFFRPILFCYDWLRAYALFYEDEYLTLDRVWFAGCAMPLRKIYGEPQKCLGK